MMLLKSTFLKQDIAKVTPNGLRYNGYYYSCGIALKDNWYLRSYEKGPWKITVFVEPENNDRIFVHMRGKGLAVASKITVPERPDMKLLADYFSRFNQAKQLYLRKKRQR